MNVQHLKQDYDFTTANLNRALAELAWLIESQNDPKTDKRYIVQRTKQLEGFISGTPTSVGANETLTIFAQARDSILAFLCAPLPNYVPVCPYCGSADLLSPYLGDPARCGECDRKLA